MSDEEKAIQVEAVRKHLEISDKTRIRTSLGTAGAVCMAIIGAAFSVTHYLDKISESQERIEASLTYKVSKTEFSDWANQLDKVNRNLKGADGTQFTVPDALGVVATRKPD
jgi:hypothetical protein